ncbi:MAG: RdgB/HAM1 family non-canonical purine NTP pyrophosphatase [Chitinispirillales bacterium]|jgi:XTP/dITP diphosphohydrolase|nr:RdgB/HAM1 family non-canonical purine NTP pyrophosphatase [Chitinispirillales bacterium]
MMTREIIIATGNKGKMKEFRELLSGINVSLSSLTDHWDPMPEIEENGSTFYENARIKADWVFERSGGVWALADDSGLEVDALGGAPGVLSARFSGRGATSDSNNKKLVDSLHGVPDNLRSARFKCVLVLKTAPDTYLSAEGCCEGRIISEAHGTKGFGYDPLFVPEGFDLTFGQISSEEKHRISHRGAAIAALYGKLHELIN